MLVVQHQVRCGWCSDQSGEREEVREVVDIFMWRESRQRGTDLGSHSLRAFSRSFETFRDRLLGSSSSRLRWLLQIGSISPMPVLNWIHMHVSSSISGNSHVVCGCIERRREAIADQR